MAWLEGWSNRLEFTIDGDRVDGDLTDFPVLLTLSSGCGINSFDATDVFDELAETNISSNGFNPLDAGANITVTSGGFVAYKNAGAAWQAIRSVDSRSEGKVYFEVKSEVMAGIRHMIGIGTAAETLTYPGDTTEGYGYHSIDGNKYNSGAAVYGNSFTQGDVIGVAVDLDRGRLWWSKNGVWQAGGNPSTSSTPAYTGVFGTFYAMVGLYDINDKVTFRTTASTIQYTIPTGFRPFAEEDINNTLKIAVTDSTGINQLPVEIEYWDWEDESAHLWALASTLTSGTDSTLYLYYDVTQPDNDLYVGDTGTTPARSVWDSDYKAVWHFNSKPLPLVDSTSNYRYGTAGSTTTLVLDKTTWSFSGSSQYVGVPYHTDLAPTDALTVEAVVKMDAWNAGEQAIISKTQTGGYRICDDPTSYHPNEYGAIVYVDGSYRVVSISDGALENIFYYMAFSFDGQYLKLFLDDSVVDTYDHGSVSTISYSQTNSLIIAGEAGTGSSPDGNYTGGDYREVRVSDIARSDAWLKATNYTVFDNFMTLADGGTPPPPDAPEPPWYESWENFYEIEIDKDRIDAPLTDFPVLVTLTSGAGINNFDAIDIFNHLTESGIDSYVSFMMPTDGDRSASKHDAMAFAYNPTITTVSGISCLSLNGSDQCIVVVEANHSDWSLGPDDFTLEAWIHADNFTNPYRIISHGNLDTAGEWSFGVGTAVSWGSGYRIGFTYNNGSGHQNTASDDLSSELIPNRWHHVALTRSAGVLNYFLDGDLKTTVSGHGYDLTAAGTTGDSEYLILGARAISSSRGEFFPGYQTRWAIHKGIARWTSNFTPQDYPTNDSYTKFYYRCDGDGSQWKHNLEMVSDPEVYSSNPATSGRGYWYFDAGGTPEEDHIEIPHHSSLSLSSADFTIEFYFKTINYSNNRNLLTKRVGTGYENFLIRHGTSGDIATYISNTAGSGWQLSFNSSQGTAPAGQWIYYTLVREGTAVSVYLNGIRVYQGTLSGDIYDSGSSPLNIGGRGDGVNGHYGYIQGLRISKGIARYTGDRFFPPDPPDGDSGPNRKKIQFADADHNRLYTEIEGWDHANRRAWLWTKVPYVTSGTNTLLYLYYDRTQEDNTTYVGDINEAPAKQVWSDNFVGVWHMTLNHYVNAVDPLYDSTTYANHMATGGFGGEAVFQRVDGLITQGTLFDNNQYYYDYAPLDPSLDLTTNYTLEAMFIPTTNDLVDQIICKASNDSNGYQLRGDSGNGPVFYTGTGTTTGRAGWQSYGWQYAAAVCLVSGTGTILYLDGSQYATGSTTGTPTNGSPLNIGRRWDGYYFDGTMAEVRISTIPRSASYVKANYYNMWDNLLTFEQGVFPLFTCSGIVTVNDTPISDIPVRLYRRLTGELVGGAYSDAEGLFTIDSPYNEEHYILALYTSSDTNALIYDRIQP